MLAWAGLYVTFVGTYFILVWSGPLYGTFDPSVSMALLLGLIVVGVGITFEKQSKDY